MTTSELNVVAEVFAQVLGTGPLGPDAHFFLLGGDSMLAVSAAGLLSQRTGRDVLIRTLFERPTVGALAAHLEAGSAPAASRPSARPLSVLERGVWAQAQLMEGLPAYHIGFAFRLSGRLDISALRSAADALVARHEALRTRYLGTEAVALPARAADFAVVTGEVTGESWRPVAEAWTKEPFDLGAGSLLRVRVLREGPNRAVLVVVTHHLACDGWSLDIVLRDLAAAYGQALSNESPALGQAVPYSAYAAEEREILASPEVAADLAYWAARLPIAGEAVTLPMSLSPAPRRTGAGGRHEFMLSPERTAALRALSADCGGTVFMAMFAALAVVLRRYGADDRLLIGVPHANRADERFQGAVGLFINLLGVPAPPISDTTTFRELMGRTRDAVLDAADHHRVPLDHVHRELRHDRVKLPAIRVVCSQESKAVLNGMPGLIVEPLGALDRGAAEYDLAYAVLDNGSRVGAALEYALDRMSPADAERMAGHVRTFIENVIDSADRPVMGVRLLPASERSMIETWAEGPPPAEHSGLDLCGIVRGHAQTRPDAVAVWATDGYLTYGELDKRTDLLARTLREHGAGPGSVVAVLLPRSVELVVALFAVLKAGAAYVPLDPSYPPGRIAMMLADCGASIMLTAGRCVPDGFDGHVIGPDQLPVDPKAPAPGGPALDDIAYTIYTSGSTGRPKGAMVSHRSLLNYVLWFNEEFGIAGDDRVLASSTPSFDAFGIELYPPLAAGGTVVMAPQGAELAPAKLLALAAEQRVTVLATVPTALRLWVSLAEFGRCRDVRQVVCGGEQLDGRVVRQMFERLAVPLRNVYGPTEATIDVSHHTCYPAAEVLDGPIPIGRPLAGTRLYVRASDNDLAPIGVSGDLYIGGVPLALGYLHRPRETAAAFLPDPLGPPGARMYATGDRAVWLADGELLFLGRDDNQAKLRGFRIELDEIGFALRSAAGVTDAVAIIREERLVGYVCVKDPDDSTTGRVLAAARETLPRHMVPTRLVLLEELPKLPNGKLDVNVLSTLAEHTMVKEREASGVTHLLAQIFREVLGEDVGPDDNLFEVGGDSISAIRIAARAVERNLDISGADVMELETIRALAARLDGQPTGSAVT
ncbi:amino acid adenylation domain-containing protein [Nonomuraea sp. NPDC050663]|uniref:amino acid adenylation domain-containing protein n=1 Tax=Nonomuraea sp. NPDC050663 TaxID=3364370 RepID=UPI0037AD3810